MRTILPIEEKEGGKDISQRLFFNISTFTDRRLRYKSLFNMHDALLSQLDDLKDNRYSSHHPAWRQVCKGMGSIKAALKDKDQTYEEFHKESLELGERTLEIVLKKYSVEEKADSMSDLWGVERQISDFLKGREDVVYIDPSKKRIDANTYNSFMYDLLQGRDKPEKEAAVNYMRSYISEFLDSKEEGEAYNVMSGLQQLLYSTGLSKDAFLKKSSDYGQKMRQKKVDEYRRRDSIIARHVFEEKLDHVYGSLSKGIWFGKKKLRNALHSIFSAKDEAEAHKRLETYIKHHGRDKVFRLQDSIREHITGFYL